MKLFDGAACNAAVEKIASGDMTALSVLYEKMGRQVYSLAYSILGREGEADEVMQETFIKIMDCANTYDEKRGNAGRGGLPADNILFRLVDFAGGSDII